MKNCCKNKDIVVQYQCNDMLKSIITIEIGEVSMAVKTINGYGQITITNEAIAMVTAHIARECYGVVDLVSRRLKDNVSELIKKKPLAKGVKVKTKDNHISINVYVIIKYGVNIKAVSESLRKSIKYDIEEFTGMIVDDVNIHVLGVRI